MKPATLRMRHWRKKNRERQRETDRRFRQRHKKKLNARDRAYYWANRKEELARNAEYSRRNFARISKRARLKKHHMTQQEHDDRLREQKKRCAICGRPFTKTPHIDHSHKTKKNRGLLCVDCNLGLGRFKDSIRILGKAIKYLRRHNG